MNDLAKWSVGMWMLACGPLGCGDDAASGSGGGSATSGGSTTSGGQTTATAGSSGGQGGAEQNTDGKAEGLVPFPEAAKVKPGETVIFSWIVYKSRAHRDKVNAKVFKDPGIACDPKTMPFDCKRMSYGGFEVAVDL